MVVPSHVVCLLLCVPVIRKLEDDVARAIADVLVDPETRTPFPPEVLAVPESLDFSKRPAPSSSPAPASQTKSASLLNFFSPVDKEQEKAVPETRSVGSPVKDVPAGPLLKRARLDFVLRSRFFDRMSADSEVLPPCTVVSRQESPQATVRRCPDCVCETETPCDSLLDMFACDSAIPKLPLDFPVPAPQKPRQDAPEKQEHREEHVLTLEDGDDDDDSDDEEEDEEDEEPKDALGFLESFRFS